MQEENVIPNDRCIHFLLFLSILITLILSFFHIDHLSIWVDEATSIYRARNLNQTLKVVFHAKWIEFPYYILLHLFLKIGDSEFIVRSLSAIFAVLAIPLLYAIGSSLLGKRVGVIAVFMLSLNTFFIRYAQEARNYTMYLFLAIVSSFYFLKAIRQPSWKYWTAYFIINILAVYTHLFSVLVILAHISFLALFYRKRIFKLHFIYHFIVFIILLILSLYFCQKINIPTWIPNTDITDIICFFLSISGNNYNNLIIYLGLCVMALSCFRDKNCRNSEFFNEFWIVIFLFTWLILPVVLVFSFSIFIKPIYVLRYLIICLPPFVLLSALGLSKIKNRFFLLLVSVIFLIYSGQSLYSYYTDFNKNEDWRNATSFVVTESKNGDAVIFFDYFIRHSFEYYLKRIDNHNVSLNLLELSSAPYSLGGGYQPPPPDTKLLKTLSQKYKRVWFILCHDNLNNIGRVKQRRFIVSFLEQDYLLKKNKNFLGINVLLYEEKK